MNLKEAKNRIAAAGYRVSCRSWEDDEMIYACSIEINGSATYGHPKAEVQVVKATGSVFTAGC